MIINPRQITRRHEVLPVVGTSYCLAAYIEGQRGGGGGVP